jgi:hypothetical protein
MRKILVTFVPGLVGACLGGVAGYYAFSWITRQGFFALVVPGALAGLGSGFCSVNHSRVRGILAGLIALVAGVVSYWHDFSPPFDTDGSLRDLVMHLHQLPPITLIMLAVGTFLGFWWGRETTNPWRHRFAGLSGE